MRVVFLLAAEKEIEQAIGFYEGQLEGLGGRFYDEVEEAVELIQKYPEGFYKIGHHTRKCLLKYFPYILLYVFEEDAIIITAVAHQHRHPISYLNRL